MTRNEMALKRVRVIIWHRLGINAKEIAYASDLHLRTVQRIIRTYRNYPYR